MSLTPGKHKENGDNIVERAVESINSAEVPFLVTHWLANFSEKQEIGVDDPARKIALQNIRRAASELASSFTALGAFGLANRPSIETSTSEKKINATFSDMKRQWSGLPSNHLENLVAASVSSGLSADALAQRQSTQNLVKAADEALKKQRQNPKSGRTVQDAVVIDEKNASSSIVPIAPSILQSPTLFEVPQILDEANPDIATPLIESKYIKIRNKSIYYMRELIESREIHRETEIEIKSFLRSLARHNEILKDVEAQRLAMGKNDDSNSASHRAVLYQLDSTETNSIRVIATLQRRLCELKSINSASFQKLQNAETMSASLFHEAKAYMQGCRDPFYGLAPGDDSKQANTDNVSVLSMITSRQHGITRRQAGRTAPLPRLAVSNTTVWKTRTEMFCNRLSHALTINMHLAFPVYCLRFDRTGRYFITGADDYLVKVFCMSDAIPSGQGRDKLKRDFQGNLRGAVLVCTLRGHAGVINDIDVSSDNCLLATASEDGDCRVWGLKDGCPIAILRGHVGGANMVSWSTLTPYRLVTTGHDGFARTWDIRDAALKRYGATIGERPEYFLKLTEEEKMSNEQQNLVPSPASQQNSHGSNNLPPLPIPETANNSAVFPPIPASMSATSHPLPSSGTSVSLPPLPPPGAANNETVVPPLPDQQGRDSTITPGRFAAGDAIDEGVKLLSKLQHGALIEGGSPGPGTRSRKPVKVICVARCPLGGHFATGADDGICRVWSDESDLDVQTIDQRSSGTNSSWMGNFDRCRKVKKANVHTVRSSSNRLLLTLTGHLSAITDLQYSHAGDRILTASQKDGVVRIWSWGADPAVSPSRELKKIVICLTNPNVNKVETSRVRRREGRTSSGSKDAKVSCDVAVWTHDDSKIVTSQCQLVKQSSTEIHPGSQYLFLWDSKTGHCLLGISDAHTMQCPVIIPHPHDASLTCSAGADGLVKIWDWNTGKCRFTHKNVVEYGPVEPAERGKHSGFLDGAFFPDGSGLVLTDDNGRVSMFDTLLFKSRIADQSEKHGLTGSYSNLNSEWMKEQYFANDYYELFYDANGYCIERGSEQPPHLAPRGVRCSHTGAPRPEEVNDAFLKLRGPSPLPEHDVRWFRDFVRFQARRVQDHSFAFHSFSSHRKTIQGEFNPETTILVESNGERKQNVSFENQNSSQWPVPSQTSTSQPNSTESRRISTSSRAQLSNNYRWRDDEDLLQNGGEDESVDSDDEDFQLPGQGSRASVQLSDSDDSVDAYDSIEMEVDSPRPRATSRQAPQSSRTSSRQAPQSSRASSRQAPQPSRSTIREAQPPSRTSSRLNERERNQYVDDSDSDEDMEYLSTNNTPSGPHVADYAIHHFRLPKVGWIARKWLRRCESKSSYEGKKIYTPQVGDSVIYVPRAHMETITQFPSLTPPWQSWPPEAVWPVVRCCIRDVRFRFPYIDYYGSHSSRGDQCRSVVAIVTLEITGIPELSTDREFCWPKPSFVAPTRSHVFELSMFENIEYPEFLFPACLYTWRLKCLEDAIRSNRGSIESLKVLAYYVSEENQDEDSEMVPYTAKFVTYANQDDEQMGQNLSNSGFCAIGVKWGDETEITTLSPWEITLENSVDLSSVERPILNDVEKRIVQTALDKLKRKSIVREWFTLPVDESRYTDYILRVEVPMDLGFVNKRLQADYYSTRQSIAADIRLIRDNCIKYNGFNSEMSIAMRNGYEEFERDTLTEEERSYYNDLETSVADSAVVPATVQQHQRSVGSNTQSRRRSTGSSAAQSRSRRPRSSAAPSRGRRSTGASHIDLTGQQGSSILENLPHPVAVSSGRRRFLRDRVEMVASEVSQRQPSRQIEDTNRGGRATRSHSRVTIGTEDTNHVASGTRTHSSASIDRHNGQLVSEVNVEATGYSGTVQGAYPRFSANHQGEVTSSASSGRQLGQIHGTEYSTGAQDDANDERESAIVGNGNVRGPVSSSSVPTNSRIMQDFQAESVGDKEVMSASNDEESNLADSEETKSTENKKGNLINNEELTNNNLFQSEGGSNPVITSMSLRSHDETNAVSTLGHRTKVTRSEASDDSSSESSVKDSFPKKKSTSRVDDDEASLQSEVDESELSDTISHPRPQKRKPVRRRQRKGAGPRPLRRQNTESGNYKELSSSEIEDEKDGDEDVIQVEAVENEVKVCSQQSRATRSRPGHNYKELSASEFEEDNSGSEESSPSSSRISRKNPNRNFEEPLSPTRRSRNAKQPLSPTRRSGRKTSKLKESKNQGTPDSSEKEPLSPARRSTRKRQKSKRCVYPNEEDSDFEEASMSPPIRGQSTGKTSKRNASCGDDDSDSSEDEPLSSLSTKRSIRIRMPKRNASDDDDSPLTTRRATRKKLKQSSSSEYDSNSDDEDEEDEEPPPSSRKSARRPPKRRNPRLKLDSVVEEMTEVDSNEEKGEMPAKRKRQQVVRKQNVSENSKRQKRAVVDEDWPEIKSKNIAEVTDNILEALRVYDQEGLFDAPVIEAYPDIKEEYLLKISQPMDFFTIEKRVHNYKSINDLRRDLIRTFQNCIDFNGESSPFSECARTMLKVMRASFDTACEDAGVTIKL